MSAKIEPRKPGDKGGYLCMPLCQNISKGQPGWEKVRCSKCNRECWKRPADDWIIKVSKLDGAYCTECALKV